MDDGFSAEKMERAIFFEASKEATIKKKKISREKGASEEAIFFSTPCLHRTRDFQAGGGGIGVSKQKWRDEIKKNNT